MTRYHNPTRPSHLKGGALVRRKGSYSPNEFRSVQTTGLEQSPAHFTRHPKTMHRAKSVPHRRYSREREHSREKSPSPYYNKNHRLTPNSTNSRSASRDRSRSKSPSKCPEQTWPEVFLKIPFEHRMFFRDTVSYITKIQ